MTIRNLFLACLLILSHSLFAQTNKFEKRMEKVYDLLEKNNVEKADEELSEVLDDFPDYGKGWDLLTKIKKHQYENAPQSTMGGLTVEVVNDGDSDGSTDSLAAELSKLLGGINLKDMYYRDYLTTMRKGLLYSDDAYECAIFMRMMYFDQMVDTNVSKKALKYYNKAESEFVGKNYNTAAKEYQRAVDEQPDFYKAQLYLGDSYYALENYEEAARVFDKLSKDYPYQIEPKKYAADSYAHMGMLDEAVNISISTMWVYPDLVVKMKLRDFAYYIDKVVQIEGLFRPIFPNSITLPYNGDLMSLSEKQEVKEENKYWEYYIEAKEKISSYCDSNGVIVKSNDLTDAKYLEVYSWEYMLDNSPESEFEEARLMRKMGLLDCYTLVSLYHPDFYPQYKAFAANNKERIENYYHKFIVSK